MNILKQVRLVEVKQDNRSLYLDYLLLADESEAIVNQYINEGELLSIQTGEQAVGVVLFTFLPQKTVEIKNLALAPQYQGRGIGKYVLSQTFALYKAKAFHKMIVGTANSSIGNLAFYQKAGFRMSEIKKDFFSKYPYPIYENGIRAIDMVMFEKDL